MYCIVLRKKTFNALVAAKENCCQKTNISASK